MPDLIDIGANLTHDSFDADRDTIIERAAGVGVERMIVTGATVAGSRQAVQLAREHPRRLYATAGVHPHHASDVDDEAIAALRELARDDAVVAVGECGLDFFRDFSPRDAQRAAFSAQLEIAVDTGKPVFLHQREAHGSFVSLLREYLPNIRGGVAHCFTGDRVELETYVELGLYIGITGWICDERRGDSLRDAVRYLPLDRVMIETDAPYLLPRDLPGKPSGRRNEPSFLPHILHTLARHMNQDVEDVASATTANAEYLFGLEPNSVL